jgi:long-chain acyl-CoA synthetase
VIHPSSYSSLGELLRDALIQYKTEIALIETNRKRENRRLSYRDFKREASRIAVGLQQANIGADSRVAILMSNQSKWLLSAYAVLYRGATLMPLDYKLSAREQLALLEHGRPAVLIVEYPLWRKLENLNVALVLVTEAPAGEDLGTAQRLESFGDAQEPQFIPRERGDIATIVYSSGTGGAPKGCMLSHGDYLSQLE